MSENYHPTIVEQGFPNHLMTRIEVWLLISIFNNSHVDDNVWFFAEYEQPQEICIDDEFALALEQSWTIDPVFCNEV